LVEAKPRWFGFEASEPLLSVPDTEAYADGRSVTRIAFTMIAASKVSEAVLDPAANSRTA
jgi:hypothetical protein